MDFKKCEGCKGNSPFIFLLGVLLGFGCSFCCLCGGYILSIKILKPIIAIKEVSQKLSKGEFDIKKTPWIQK